MKESEILKKAIEKARKQGYKRKGRGFEWIFEPRIKEYYPIIFSHSFARAFWKSGQPYFIKNGKNTKRQSSYTDKSWKTFLKQMVISENPIKYLEQFI